MPFIFHSKKQSIFDIKRVNENDQFYIKQQQKNQFIKYKNSTGQASLQICRDHPFRILAQKDESDYIQAIKQKTVQVKHSKQKDTKYKLKRPAYRKQNIEQASISNNKKDMDLALIISESSLRKQPSRIHKNQPTYNSLKRSSSQLKTLIKSLNCKSNKFETPGPGYYQTEQYINKENKIKYETFKTQPLPPVKSNPLNAIDKSQDQEDLNFSYKNQMSAVFKPAKTKNNKTNKLMALIFGKKQTLKDIDQQTNCQSRHRDDNVLDENYEKAEARSPSPCSYDPKINFPKPCSKKGTLIQNSKKFIQILSEPIYIPQAPSHKQPIQLSKKPCPSIQIPFISNLPRQLHFDTELYGSGQFYYSPKNNISDLMDKERRTGFGSNIKRFRVDQVHKVDPYKYCNAKAQYHNHKQNYCPSLSFTDKRQLFKPLENEVAPNQYQYTGQTISKGVQDIVLQQLLQQKYTSSVSQMRKRKLNMEKKLYQEDVRKNDLSTPLTTPYQQLQPDRYHQSHLQQKQLQKQNISFGLKKDVIIDRGFKPKKELDGYYEVGLDWDKRSYNRGYGYQLFQMV